MNFFNENLINEIENTILSDFESIFNDKQLNQQKILKYLTKIVFCVTKLISQIPSIFNELQAQINNSSQIIQEKLTIIDSELNFFKNFDFCIAQNKKYDLIKTATVNGHLSIVQYLIEKKNVDKDIKGKSEEKTPLHYACEKGHIPIVEYLISKGANIEANDWLKWTPLHYASFYGKTDVVKYLVSIGAEKHAIAADFRTPFDLACEDEYADKSQKNEFQNILG